LIRLSADPNGGFDLGRFGQAGLKAVTPTYRFYLDVERVVFPEFGSHPREPRILWSRETFGVAGSRKSARISESPGFRVDPDLRARMLHFMESVLLVRPERAKVLPFSGDDDPTVGKRVSQHPLHDMFIGPEYRHEPEAFYAKVPPEALVADVRRPAPPPPDEELKIPQLTERVEEPLPRVQRVFTMRFDDLFEIWEQIAREWLQGHPPHPPE
jgi:hypothetical protein